MQHQQPTEQQATGTVAIYHRVAVCQEHASVNYLPHRMLDDLIALARQLGFRIERIAIYEERGISGKAPIAKRPGLQALLDAIAQGSIQAVMVTDEHRLFQGATSIEVNVFIKVCQEHSVKVITPQIVYDFSNPMHVQLFRFLAETGSFVMYARTTIGRRHRKQHQEQSMRSHEDG